MIKYLSEYIYYSAMTPLKRRALAFAIYVKTHKPASVLKDMSYRQVAKLVGFSHETCRYRIGCLKRMGLLKETFRNGHHYYTFTKLRSAKIKNRHSEGFHYPKFSDIDISILDTRSVDSIEMGLMAMCPVEIQRNKERVKQLDKSKQNPRNAAAFKKASGICRKRGYDGFDDDGISYEHIASILHCSYSTVSKMIQFGVKHHFFKVFKSPALFMEGDEIRYADEIWIIDEMQDIDKRFPIHYVRGNRAFYQPANRFKLPRALQPHLKWK